ncbi:MAG: GNAT family N-acetyltransferase [Acidimicrobiales bacterium]
MTTSRPPTAAPGSKNANAPATSCWSPRTTPACSATAATSLPRQGGVLADRRAHDPLGPNARGRGVGAVLIDALIERARSNGKHVLVAGCDGGNEGAIRFHERHGFRKVADMPAIGRKRGKPVDLVLLQLDLHREAP